MTLVERPLHPEPGACPRPIVYNAIFNTNAPGTVRYRVRSDYESSDVQSLTIERAGETTVASIFRLSLMSSASGQTTLETSAPNVVRSNSIPYSWTCDGRVTGVSVDRMGIQRGHCPMSVAVGGMIRTTKLTVVEWALDRLGEDPVWDRFSCTRNQTVTHTFRDVRHDFSVRLLTRSPNDMRSTSETVHVVCE